MLIIIQRDLKGLSCNKDKKLKDKFEIIPNNNTTTYKTYVKNRDRKYIENKDKKI